MAHLGLQLYTVKDAAAADLIGTIRAVGEMGYDGVEFAGYFGTPMDSIRAALDETGMQTAATHILLAEIEREMDKVADDCGALGCPTVICPFIPRDERTDAAGWKRVAARMNSAGRQLRERGITFLYHHHNFDFDTVDGTTGMDILLAELDPSLVGFELDAYWVECAGRSALDFYETHHERIPSIHFKNMKDRESREDTEIGSGVLDLGPLVAAALSQGAIWLVVEQEKFDLDPVESARLNLADLRRLVEAVS
jgi:sugar phosphate isomerase/epimerase